MLICHHCSLPSSLKTLPLCEECLRTLQNSHSAPFELGQPVDDAFAFYSLNDENYRILKSWKKRRSPIFDRRVLKPDWARDWLAGLPRAPQAIVPMPQSLRRTLQLGGTSPVSIIALSLSRTSGLPVKELLEMHAGLFIRRQAELGYWERLSSPMDFGWKESSTPPDSVILVDDFVTTGHTAREAARRLKLEGVRAVYVVGLGARVAAPPAC